MGDRLATIDMNRILGGLCPFSFFVGGSAGSPCNTMAWCEAYHCTKWHLDPSRRLAITDIGRKLGGLCPPPFFLGGGAGSTSSTMRPGPRPTSLTSGILIHPAIWPQQIWAKNWELYPFEGEGAGSPSNTMCHPKTRS